MFAIANGKVFLLKRMHLETNREKERKVTKEKI